MVIMLLIRQGSGVEIDDLLGIVSFFECQIIGCQLMLVNQSILRGERPEYDGDVLVGCGSKFYFAVHVVVSLLSIGMNHCIG